MKIFVFIFGLIVLLGVAEYFVVQMYRNSGRDEAIKPAQEETLQPTSRTPVATTEAQKELTQKSDAFKELDNFAVASFPAPTTEVVNGKTERTIHIGVRQYVWEPNTITAKKGELVRLLVHNADVPHGLVIPDLGVNQYIPEDGAVVEFTPNKNGTFEFFCSVWCGEGHMEMRGKIIIE